MSTFPNHARRRFYGLTDGGAKMTLLAGGVFLASFGACAAPKAREQTVSPAGPEGEVAPPRPARVQPGRTVALPGLVVDLDSRELRIDGRVCIEHGVLEYAAVAAGGKEYESIFSLDCRPSHLHVALLIAGYRAGDVAPELRGDFSPQADPAANQPPDGAPRGTEPPEDYWKKPSAMPTRVSVEVDVRQSDGTWRRRPVEDFLLDRGTDRSPDQLTWAFTGSFFYREPTTRLEVFVADVEKSLISFWYDPAALLNLIEDVGNPYRGDAAGLEVNPAALPARDTPVRIVLRPVSTTSR